jgi:periplasmic divalent cation tolerance protein
MHDDEPVEVIITAPDRDWLEDLCRRLVDARLAASAHVIHPVTSIYQWEGNVHEATEARAFLRSRASALPELTDYVVARHPYEVPNITALPIVGGNAAYIAWIKQETKSSDAAHEALGD